MATDFHIKNAKPLDKDYTINVSDGLSILVKKTGSKLWRYRYSYAGKRHTISVGKYPQITLKQARSKVRGYQNLLEEGINPSTHKHLEKVNLQQQRTLQSVSLEWYERRYVNGSYKESDTVLGRLKKYLFPKLGKVPIRQVEPSMMYNLVEAIQEQGYIETGKRVNTYASMIFRYGVAKGYCEQDVTQHYKGMLITAPVNHIATLTNPDEIGKFMHDMTNYRGTYKVRYAMQIQAYIFVRASELVNSKWEFIDFDKQQWLIPAEFMKMNRDHLIPLPKQVITLLQKLYPITGHSEYLFPVNTDDSRPMHPETVNKSIRRIENGKYVGKIVSHGFRSMASTILNENGFRPEVIEKQLAHQERNKARGAYNHAEYLEERAEMMQWYANYLDELSAYF